jgi:hypothetical protein
MASFRATAVIANLSFIRRDSLTCGFFFGRQWQGLDSHSAILNRNRVPRLGCRWPQSLGCRLVANLRPDALECGLAWQAKPVLRESEKDLGRPSLLPTAAILPSGKIAAIPMPGSSKVSKPTPPKLRSTWMRCVAPGLKLKQMDLGRRADLVCAYLILVCNAD